MIERSWVQFLEGAMISALILIHCLFHLHVTAVACKRPWSLCQKCRWQFTLNTNTPLTQWSWIGQMHSVGTQQGNELMCDSTGNTYPQSSQLAEPQWIDFCLKSGTDVWSTISTTTKKLGQAGNESSNLLPRSTDARKRASLHHVAL